MKPDDPAEDFDGSFEKHDGGCAVHVVIAVEQNWLAICDGRLDAPDGGFHSQHEERIVKLRDVGIEKSEGLAGLSDCASNQQFAKYERESGSPGQFPSLVRMRSLEDPALAWSAGGFNGANLSRAHKNYSSSSLCSRLWSSMTISWKLSMSSSRDWKRSYHSVVVSCRKTMP